MQQTAGTLFDSVGADFQIGQPVGIQVVPLDDLYERRDRDPEQVQHYQPALAWIDRRDRVRQAAPPMLHHGEPASLSTTSSMRNAPGSRLYFINSVPTGWDESLRNLILTSRHSGVAETRS